MSVDGSDRMYQASNELEALLFDSSYCVLSYSRVPGLNPWEVCRSLLKCILAPETNTQKIAVPLSSADELSSMTCFVAARIYSFIHQSPAEYARWVEQLSFK
jgi:hypothetical protein